MGTRFAYVKKTDGKRAGETQRIVSSWCCRVDWMVQRSSKDSGRTGRTSKSSVNRLPAFSLLSCFLCKMAAVHLRKAFHYPTDGSDEDDGPMDLDEEGGVVSTEVKSLY